jgi:hypothetical protein
MHVKEKRLENQNIPFQEECIDSATSVSYVLEDKVSCNGELLCISVDLYYFTRYM